MVRVWDQFVSGITRQAKAYRTISNLKPQISYHGLAFEKSLYFCEQCRFLLSAFLQSLCDVSAFFASAVLIRRKHVSTAETQRTQR